MISILKECIGAKKIAISGHSRPDGDCVSAALALYQYLKKALPKAKIQVLLEQPSEIFSDLMGYREIGMQCEEQEVFDVFFLLDCEKSRLGEFLPCFEAAKKTINIDHHISNQNGCAMLNYVNPEIGSTCEVLFDLLEKNYLDADIAKAIYTGIIHDTGVFQYSNTTPKTMRIAAQLMEFGFDFSELIDKTFYEKTYVQNQILGRTLLESIMIMDGKCIVGVLEQKIIDFYGVSNKDLDGIVNQLRITKGVECAIFLYETTHMQYKASLRSTDRVDVSKVAAVFGGGGHKKAAGCTLNGTLYDAINNLSAQIERQLLAK